ncbi:hypothetical protein GCM10025794_02510 [Massilia kyonggiensis]|nr:hypothetical protein [Massilia kyonggiensis]
MDEQVKPKKKIKVSRNVFEHGHLNSIALNQLKQAKAEEDGHRFRWIIPSMAFSCFRVEALCNIYGSQLFPHWDHFESTSFIGKIVLISEFLKIKVNFSAEPWQTINKMKNFRNTLAHAKPQIAFDVHEVPNSFPEQFLPFPKEKKSILWYSSIENAEHFNDVADELEMLWMNNVRVLGFLVDTSGRRVFEKV